MNTELIQSSTDNTESLTPNQKTPIPHWMVILSLYGILAGGIGLLHILVILLTTSPTMGVPFLPQPTLTFHLGYDTYYTIVSCLNLINLFFMLSVGIVVLHGSRRNFFWILAAALFSATIHLEPVFRAEVFHSTFSFLDFIYSIVQISGAPIVLLAFVWLSKKLQHPLRILICLVFAYFGSLEILISIYRLWPQNSSTFSWEYIQFQLQAQGFYMILASGFLKLVASILLYRFGASAKAIGYVILISMAIHCFRLAFGLWGTDIVLIVKFALNECYGLGCSAILVFALVYYAPDFRIPKKEENRCHTCGYDLTGNVSGRCPECGEAIVAQ